MNRQERVARREQRAQIVVPRFSTNGAITKFLMKLKGDFQQVKEAAKKAMMQFSLSSMKMLYDNELHSLDPEIKKALLEAAEETDQLKYNQMKSHYPLFPPPWPFGRAKHR